MNWLNSQTISSQNVYMTNFTVIKTRTTLFEVFICVLCIMNVLVGWYRILKVMHPGVDSHAYVHHKDSTVSLLNCTAQDLD